MTAEPRATRLFVARHGRVAEEWRARLYGGLDVPLAPEGEAQSRALAAQLAGVRIDAVVSSGLARAEHAAACLREGRGTPRRDEPDLREISRGEWAGLTFEELERRSPGAWAAWTAEPATSRPPGGESLGDLAARALACLERLAAEHAGGTVAVVAHSWVARVAVCRTLGLPLAAARSLYLAAGGLCQLDWPAEEGVLPTLGGFGLDGLPSPGLRWYRGPRPGG